MGNYYTDAYSNCPIDQNPKEGATKEGCAGCAYFREPWTCKNPAHVCTLSPEERKTIKLPRTGNWELFTLFVRHFTTAEIVNQAKEDGTIEAVCDFGWFKAKYSDFCKDPQAEYERVIGDLEKLYAEKIESQRKSMRDFFRDNGVEVRDG